MFFFEMSNKEYNNNNNNNNYYYNYNNNYNNNKQQFALINGSIYVDTGVLLNLAFLLVKPSELSLSIYIWNANSQS